jgi:hypothetical protein
MQRTSAQRETPTFLSGMTYGHSGTASSGKHAGYALGGFRAANGHLCSPWPRALIMERAVIPEYCVSCLQPPPVISSAHQMA